MLALDKSSTEETENSGSDHAESQAGLRLWGLATRLLVCMSFSACPSPPPLCSLEWWRRSRLEWCLERWPSPWVFGAATATAGGGGRCPGLGQHGASARHLGYTDNQGGSSLQIGIAVVGCA